MKKEKIFQFIGQAVCYVAFSASWTAILYFSFLSNTIF